MILKDICYYVNERIDSSFYSISDYISTENMVSEKGGIKIASSLPEGKFIHFSQDDILISNIRPYFKKIWQANKKGCCSTDVLCIRANDNVDSKYLYYLLSQDLFFSHVMSGAKGSKMPRGDKQHIMQWEIQVPSLNHQRRIASILSSLDRKIEINNQINARLEEIAQALFKSWFIDFEPFKDQKFVESEIGLIPEGWQVNKISNLCYSIGIGKRPKGGALTEGIPSIGAEQIKGMCSYNFSKTKYVDKTFSLKIKAGKIEGYELLIYKDGGKPGYFIPNFSIFGEGYPFDECYINEHVFKLDFCGNKGFNIFCYFYFQTDCILNYFNVQGAKAAIPGINKKDIENISILTPDNFQVEQFGKAVLPLFKKILKNAVENRHLASLRDTLLPKLMSGEIEIKA